MLYLCVCFFFFDNEFFILWYNLHTFFSAIVDFLYFAYLTEDIVDKTLCTVTLNADSIEKFRHAIEELYYFEFIIGNLFVCVHTRTRTHT